MPIITAASLEPFVQDLFVAAGVPEDSARTVAGSLVEANLCGHDSHGVMRAPQYIGFLKDGKYHADVPLTVLHETPAVLATDGCWGLGQVQAYRLLDKLMAKAKLLGVAAGSVRNCGHIGRLGEYAEAAAVQNLAFFATVNSHGAGRRVVPPGGTEGRISTNPICFGVPTTTHPVVLDFGTSAVAEGKVRVHHQKKIPTPEGWLVDSTGQPTTDPGVLYAEPRGSILPFGGPQAYKGFGLGLMLDLLAGGLSGGRCSNPGDPLAGVGNAVVFVLFDPVAFGGVEHFLGQADRLTGYVRSCPPAPGGPGIVLPGDPERVCKAQRSANGIDIPTGTWGLLVKSAEELGVEVPTGS